MPKLTQAEYDNYLRITGHKHPWDRSRPGVQKQEDHLREATHHSAEGEEVDAELREGYLLEVEILVSDRRRRDLDGALATICDCIVAVGRQLESDTEDHSQGKGSPKGG